MAFSGNQNGIAFRGHIPATRTDTHLMDAALNGDQACPSDSVNRVPMDVIVRRHDTRAIVASHHFEKPYFIVGRIATCDIPLGDASVSLRHLYVQYLGGRVIVVDLGSPDFGKRQGILGRPGRTFVDEWRPGEEVRVGQFVLTYTVPANLRSAPLQPHERPSAQFPGPVAVWELTNVNSDDETMTSRQIRHELTLIGRNPLCRFRIAHNSISTVHACLVYQLGQLQVVDLCSRNGVFVNGSRISSSTLTEGDELLVGDCRGTIKYYPPPSVPEAASERSPEAGSVVDLASLTAFDVTVTAEFTGELAEAASLSEMPVVETTPVETAPEVPPVQNAAVDEPPGPDAVDAGIVVTSTAEGVVVHQIGGLEADPVQKPSPGADVRYSEEFVLSMIHQFTEMQHQLLQQTQQMLKLLATCVQQSSPDGDAKDRPVLRSTPTEELSVEQLMQEQEAAGPQAPIHGDAPPGMVLPGMDDQPPDLHGWLNSQLADLDQPGNPLQRLWRRLRGE